MIDCSVFSSRSWQSRRVLWTDTYIVFSRADQDVLIDSIPLYEIKSIEPLDDALNDTNRQSNEDDSAKTQFQSLLTSKRSVFSHLEDAESCTQERNSHSTIDQDPQASITTKLRPQMFGGSSERILHSSVIQIKTDLDGHNSGRTYYIRTKTSGDDGQLITTLSSLAKSAKIRAENKSRFERNQLQVRRVYNSHPFQYLMACLIFGVHPLYFASVSSLT